MSKANLARPLPQPADPDLPEGWVTCGLADIVSPSKQKVHPDDCPDIPYLSLEHIESGTGRILSQGVGSDVSSDPLPVNWSRFYGRILSAGWPERALG